MRDSPERDISSLGAMGQGLGRFPDQLMVCVSERARFGVSSSIACDFAQGVLHV